MRCSSLNLLLDNKPINYNKLHSLKKKNKRNQFTLTLLADERNSAKALDMCLTALCRLRAAASSETVGAAALLAPISRLAGWTKSWLALIRAN